MKRLGVQPNRALRRRPTYTTTRSVPSPVMRGPRTPLLFVVIWWLQILKPGPTWPRLCVKIGFPDVRFLSYKIDQVVGLCDAKIAVRLQMLYERCSAQVRCPPLPFRPRPSPSAPLPFPPRAVLSPLCRPFQFQFWLLLTPQCRGRVLGGGLGVGAGPAAVHWSLDKHP